MAAGNNDNNEDNPWFPLLGDLNPMVYPSDGFQFTRSMIGKGISQVKTAVEWVMDQGQNALPTFPVEAIVLKVYKPPPLGATIFPLSLFAGPKFKQPQRVICYIPELHSHIPMWKTAKTSEMPEEQRLIYNRKILSLIGSGGGSFVIHQDTPEFGEEQLSSGDKVLVDYQDRKNFNGGRILKILEINDANFLPAEWQNLDQGNLEPAASKPVANAFEDAEKVVPLSSVTSPTSDLDVPPAVYNNEDLDPEIEPNFRPFLHPTNGKGVITSGTPLRNSKNGTHGGLDFGPNAVPIYAMADGYCSFSTQLTGKTGKQYVSKKHIQYLKEEAFTETSGEKAGSLYVLRDTGMNNEAGWYCEIIHSPEFINGKRASSSDRRNNKERYTTRYLHMISPPLIKKGEKVTRGQLIGYVGGTPFFGAHLHLDINYKLVRVDPSPYVYMDIDAIAMMENGGIGHTPEGGLVTRIHEKSG